MSILNKYMPHGHCYLWQKDLLLLHVVSDLIIFLCYFIIPIFLIVVFKKRKDIKISYLIVYFSLFIIFCGAGHLLTVIEVWKGYYYISGILKLFTALVSVLTVIELLHNKHILLTIPTISTHKEIIEDKRKLEDLIENLEKKTKILPKYEQITLGGHKLADYLFKVKETLPFGLVRVDFKGKVLEANQKFNVIAKQTNTVGTYFQDWTHEDDLEMDLDQVHKLINYEIPHYEIDKRYNGDDTYNNETAFVKLNVLALRRVNDLGEMFIAIIEPLNDSDKQKLIDRDK